LEILVYLMGSGGARWTEQLKPIGEDDEIEDDEG